MPSRPPTLNGKPRAARRATGWGKRPSRQARGYDRAHELMRERVLIEEPLCRACQAEGRVSATTRADHIIPLAEGGTGERSNYQGLCHPCHVAKTARESARARKRGQHG